MKHKPIADLLDLKIELTAVIKAAVEQVAHAANRGSWTIREFCQRHSISECQYHRLRTQGRGPKTMNVGSQGLRISRQAEADWVADREREERKRPWHGGGHWSRKKKPLPEVAPSAPRASFPGRP